jgi:Ca2+-binding EF-hand superfamily protein/CRP-like cAMP-binding protein
LEVHAVSGKPGALRLSWTFDADAGATSFEFRTAEDRAFMKPTEILARAPGDSRSFILGTLFSRDIPLWHVPKPTWVQIRALKSGGLSRWSLAVDPWLVAASCPDDAFLDVRPVAGVAASSGKLKDWSCEPCPTGAACVGPSIWENVRAKQGWWRVPWSPKNGSEFEQCPYKHDCLGYASSLVAVDQNASAAVPSRTTPAGVEEGCLEGTGGVLCSICEPGYTRDGNICVECTDASFGIRVGIFLLCCAILGMTVVAFQRRLKHKWKKYGSIWRDVLKIGSILVTFAQINSSLPLIIDVPWPTIFVNFLAHFDFVNLDLLSLIGASCVGDFDFRINFCIMSCLPIGIMIVAWAQLRCERAFMHRRIATMGPKQRKLTQRIAFHDMFMLADYDNSGQIDPEEMSSILNQLGWKVTTMLTMDLFKNLGAESNKHGQLVLREQQFLDAMSSGKVQKALQNRNVHRRQRSRSLWSRKKKSNGDSKATATNPSGNKPKLSRRMSLGQRVVNTGKNLVNATAEKTRAVVHTQILSSETALIKWTLRRRIFANALSGAMQLLLLAHTPISRKVFQYFHCNNISGREYVRADYRIVCFSAAWSAFLPVVLVVFILFTMALPGSISYYLWTRRHALYSTAIFQKIGFLYSAFTRGAEFWTVHDVLLKMVLTGMLIYVPNKSRAAVAILIWVLAIANLNLFEPHKNKILFWLTQLSFFVSASKYTITLLLSEATSEDESNAIGIMLVTMDCVFLLAAALAVVLAMLAMRSAVSNMTAAGIVLGEEDEDEKEDKNAAVPRTAVVPVSSVLTAPIRQGEVEEEEDHAAVVMRVMSESAIHESHLQRHLTMQLKKQKRSTLMRVEARKKLRATKTLRRVPAFSHLPASAIDAIMGAMKFRKYVDGDVVCKQGGDADFFAIIITGSCYIALNGATNDEDGTTGEEIRVATLSKNQYFGETAIQGDLTSHDAGSLPKRTATVVVNSEHLQMLELKRKDFAELVETGVIEERALSSMRSVGEQRQKKNTMVQGGYLSAKQAAKLQEAFSNADIDHSGTLAMDEFKAMMTTLGADMSKIRSDEDLRAFVRERLKLGMGDSDDDEEDDKKEGGTKVSDGPMAVTFEMFCDVIKGASRQRQISQQKTAVAAKSVGSSSGSTAVLIVSMIAASMAMVSDAATVCPKGKYVANTACKVCGPGQFQSLDDFTGTACKLCKNGTNLLDVEPFTAAFHDNPNDCTPCQKMTFNPNPGLGSLCLPCPTATSTGSDTCDGCDPGRYKKEVTGECVNCAQGRHTDDRDLAECRDCPAGFHAKPGRPFDVCVPCPRGTFGIIDGGQSESHACQDCEVGRFSDLNGVAHDPGTATLPCVACPVGTWSSAVRAQKESICIACESGRFSTTLAANSSKDCTRCQEGTFSESVGASTRGACKSCPSGYANALSAGAYCLPCVPATFAENEGATNCKPCPVGSYTDDSAQAVCRTCPSGFRADAKGSVVCSFCPVGRFGSGCAAQCPSGTYRDGDDAQVTTCRLCGAGRFQNVGGKGSCLPCFPGTVTGNSNGTVACEKCGVGYFAPDSGGLVCNQCEPGYTSRLGAAFCVECGAGRAGVACQACEAGTFRRNGARNVLTCEMCQPGFHQPSRGKANCLRCMPGRSSWLSKKNNTRVANAEAALNMTSCFDCDAGRFAQLSGSANCSKCPAGFNSMGGSVSCATCPAGKYGEGCKACAKGFFRRGDDPVVLRCKACANGTFQPKTGTASCLPCTPGKVTTQSGCSHCTNCGVGEFAVNSSSSSCERCPSGFAADAPGSAACTLCKAGKYGNGCLDCEKGQYRVGDDPISTKCKLCKPGFAQTQRAQQSCLPCIPGSKASGHGNAECIRCGVNEFASEPSSTVCLVCAPGRTTAAEGSVACSSCGAGRYRQGATNGDEYSCPDCPPGRVSGKAGSTTCTACGLGFFQTQPGAASCEPCPAGRWGNATGASGMASSCITCDKGRYSTASQGALSPDTCTLCAPGKFSDLVGASKPSTCQLCGAGQVSQAGAIRCAPCKAGFYQPRLGTANCLPCNPGSYQLAEGSLTCTQCSPGTFAKEPSALRCENCLPGHGTIASTRTRPDGTEVTIRGGAATCVPCAKGRYSSSNTTSGLCIDCPVDHYQDKEKLAICKSCPAGFGTEQGSGAVFCSALPGPILLAPIRLTLLAVRQKPGALRLSWELDTRNDAAADPDLFTFRTATDRAFVSAEIMTGVAADAASRDIVVPRFFASSESDTFPLWLFPDPTWTQVRAGKEGNADLGISETQSPWSIAADPWVAAASCGDDAFLDVSPTALADWACSPCPEGASCVGPSVWEDVKAKQGWWRVPWADNGSKFELCPFEADCVGYRPSDKNGSALVDSATDVKALRAQTAALSDEGCLEGTGGVLCSICEEGWTRDGNTCNECSDESFPIRVGLFLLGVAILSAIFAACQRRMKRRWRKYSTLWIDVLQVGGMVISFGQINSSLPLIIDVPFPRSFLQFLQHFAFMNMDVMSLIGASCVGDFRFMLNFTCMAALPIGIVLLAWVKLRVERSRLATQLRTMSPRHRHRVGKEALHELFMIADEDNSGEIDPQEMTAILKALGWHIDLTVARVIAQGVGAHANERGHMVLTEDQFLEAMLSGSMERALSSHNVHRAKSAEASGADARKRTKRGRSTKLRRKSARVLKASWLSEIKEKLLTTETAMIKWTLRRRYFASALSGTTQLLLLAHTPVSRKVFQYFHCNDVAGRLYVRVDYTLVCGSAEWWAFLPVVLAVLVLFTVALPAGIGMLLFVRRKHLYSTAVFQQMGYLYSGFTRGAEFWTVHDVLMKMILTGMLIYVPTHARAGTAILVCLVAVANLNKFEPHRNRALFWLSQLSFVVTSAKYVMTLLLRGEDVSAVDSDSVGVVMILLDLSFILSAFLSVFLAVAVAKQKIRDAQKVALILGDDVDEIEEVAAVTPVDTTSLLKVKPAASEPSEEEEHHNTVRRLMSHHSIHEDALREKTNKQQALQRRNTNARVAARLHIRKSRTLTRVPAFSSLSPEGMETIVNAMEYKRYVDGDIVVREGDTADRFFVIVTGSCFVSLHRPGGAMRSVGSVEPDELRVATLKALDFFGETAFDGIDLKGRNNKSGDGSAGAVALPRRTATVTVQKDDVQMLELGRDTFAALITSGVVNGKALEEMTKTREERAQRNKAIMLAVKEDESTSAP